MKNNFRKLLSTFLSAILVLSVTVAGWPATVSAENVDGFTIIENKNLLLENASPVTDFGNLLSNATWSTNNIQYSKITAVADSAHGGPALEMTWPSSQSIYTTVKLEANTTYNFRASFFANGVNLFEVYYFTEEKKLTTFKTSKKTSLGYPPTDGATKIARLNGTDITPCYKFDATSQPSWKDFTYSFTTPNVVNATYVINIRFDDCKSAALTYPTTNAKISDYSLNKDYLAAATLNDSCTKTNLTTLEASGATNDRRASDDSGHGGTCFKRTLVAYQSVSLKTLALEPNTTYRLRFSAKVAAINLLEFYEVEKGTTPNITETNNSATNKTKDGVTTYTNSAYTVRLSGTTKIMQPTETAYTDYDWTFTTSSNTSRDYYINVRADACNTNGLTDIGFYSDFSLVQVRTEFATAYNNGASIRLGSNTEGKVTKDGLRVKNEITKNFIQNNGIVEYGSVVTAKNLNGDELTLDTTGAIKGVSYSKKDNINLLWDETSDSYIYTAYIVGFGENAENYAKDLTVRSYAKNSNGKVYYGETFTVCLYDVVYAIQNSQTVDGNQPSDTDTATAKAFIQKDSDAYNNWVNTKTEQ